MAAVTVRIPTPLRGFAGGAAEVGVEGVDVRSVLGRLVDGHPNLRRHLLSSDGTVKKFVAVYVNDADIRAGDREATRLAEGDVVSIVPAIAGGAPVAGPGRATLVALGGSPPLNDAELHRYSRHLLLPEVGVRGQKALRDAKVLVVGAGGLGAPLSLYLAAAGVGEIGIVDQDTVELSNLQRQVLYSTADVGRPKLDAARERLLGLNPGLTIRLHPGRLQASNALETLRPYDLVVDGTDNFPTRYLVNDACVLLGKPNVYGSIYRFEGQVSVFDARRGPCYRCLYSEPPPPDLVPSCAEAGVLGVLPGVVGTLQATETIKLITGVGSPLIGRLLLYDAAGMRFRELKITKSPTCVLCSPAATQRGLIDYEEFCGVQPMEARMAGVPEVTALQLRDELAGDDPPLLVDVREPQELEISHLDGALLIPQDDLPERLGELTAARSVVVFCRSGGRSADAVRTLLGLGFDRVRSLKGGINAWSKDVDPKVAVY